MTRADRRGSGARARTTCRCPVPRTTRRRRSQGKQGASRWQRGDEDGSVLRLRRRVQPARIPFSATPRVRHGIQALRSCAFVRACDTTRRAARTSELQLTSRRRLSGSSTPMPMSTPSCGNAEACEHEAADEQQPGPPGWLGEDGPWCTSGSTELYGRSSRDPSFSAAPSSSLPHSSGCHGSHGHGMAKSGSGAGPACLGDAHAVGRARSGDHLKPLRRPN